MPDSDWFLSNEAQLRLAAFLSLFALMLLTQHFWPRRKIENRWRTNVTNIMLVLIDTAVLRLAFPLLAFDLAIEISEERAGFLDGLSPVVSIVAGVFLLDLVVYWQHRLLHIVPIFWRLHRVHHADIEFDVTTGIRFHPVEIVVSMLLKLAIIYVFAIAPLSVLIFELALSIGALFTHTNWRLSLPFERVLRWFFVTPEMHRIHHSVYPEETNSNYGFHLSLWDRIFGSYRDSPRDGHIEMKIGLSKFRTSEEQSLIALLLNPFR